MTDKINFQGKIMFSQGNLSVTFDKTNVSIIAEKISNEYENIKGDTISILRGYKYISKIELILLNSDTENFGKLNKLLGMMSLIGMQNALTLSLYKQDNSTVSIAIPFHTISGDIKYTDYLVNVKVGIKFNISLETRFIVSPNNLINGWQG